MIISKKLIGKRIRLIHTSDPYTKLKQGAKGTITGISTVDIPPKPFTQIFVKWNNGSNLALIYGEDRFEVETIPEENCSDCGWLVPTKFKQPITDKKYYYCNNLHNTTGTEKTVEDFIKCELFDPTKRF